MSKIALYSETPFNTEDADKTWQEAFERKMIAGYWNWWFLKNPVNDKVYVSYVFEDSVLKTHYAVSPVNIQVKSRIFKAGLINMAMTHPQWQGKGLLVEAGKYLHQQLIDDGFIFLISFPARNVTHHTFKKYFNWQDIGDLVIMSYISGNKQKKEHKGFHFTTGRIETSKINELKNEYSNISEKWNIIKDEKYLLWRLTCHPVNLYKLLEIESLGKKLLMIYKEYNNEADLVQVFYSHENKELYTDYFLKGTEYLSERYSRINIWAFKDTLYEKTLVDLGYSRGNLITHFGFVPLNSEWIDLNPENWDISFVDSDVY